MSASFHKSFLLMTLTRHLSSKGVSINKPAKLRGEGHTSRAFIDMKRVTIEAGTGGDGCISFDRLFCNPNGGPGGGDGGNGAHVVFQANAEVIDFAGIQSIIRAPDGAAGSGNHRHGANAKHLYVQVPLSTQVHLLSSPDSDVSAHRSDSASLLGTLSSQSETLIAARGGSGGRGNAFLASSNHSLADSRPADTPLVRDAMVRLAERGASGESKRILLRLPNFADIGLLGAPNAGKSTLLRRLTRARPRVAPHPFTTLKPHVGTMIVPGETEDESRTVKIADLPGLIEGAAARNAGLGAQFLSLVEGCSLLVYLIDIGTFLSSSEPEHRRASRVTTHFSDQINMLQHELRVFNPQLVSRARSLVIGTKIDMISPAEGTIERLAACLAKASKEAGLESANVLLISSRRGDNIDKLSQLIGEIEIFK